jgi:hypothetical protein
MTVIELMLEALKATQSTLKQLLLENSPLYEMNAIAIAAGEAELRREPDHYRAILSASLREQIHTRLHVIVFRDRKSGEDFVESEKTFGGWDYTLEPLYTREETK